MTRYELAPALTVHTHACGENGIFVNAYLTLAGHVKKLANGKGALTEEEVMELERRMSEYLPGGGLTFLIAMNADPIARDLGGAR
jgi:hypothetical protein